MQLCLNFSLTAGTREMEALYRLRVSSWEQTLLLQRSTRLWCQTARRWTCPVLLRQQPSGCVTWCMNSCLHGDKEGVLQLQLDTVEENVVLKDETGKF